MIHAYNKLYLEKARIALGRMLDFSVYDLGYELPEFYDMFIVSGIAERFGNGDITIIAGRSGYEIAYEVLYNSDLMIKQKSPRYVQNRSREYWTGWALAYYQWYTNISFQKINHYIPIEEIKNLYMPYHEMDIRQFVDKMNSLFEERKISTNLKLRRMNCNLSQKELADLSGVPVRTIQQYEQKQKNINKAQFESIMRLSKVLYCVPEDLFEPLFDLEINS